MITAKEAFALSKSKALVQKSLELIEEVIKAHAKFGETKIWYKLPPNLDVAKEVRVILEGLGYEVNYSPIGNAIMLRISWGE